MAITLLGATVLFLDIVGLLDAAPALRTIDRVSVQSMMADPDQILATQKAIRHNEIIEISGKVYAVSRAQNGQAVLEMRSMRIEGVAMLHLDPVESYETAKLRVGEKDSVQCDVTTVRVGRVVGQNCVVNNFSQWPPTKVED